MILKNRERAVFNAMANNGIKSFADKCCGVLPQVSTLVMRKGNKTEIKCVKCGRAVINSLRLEAVTQWNKGE